MKGEKVGRKGEREQEREKRKGKQTKERERGQRSGVTNTDP